MSVKIIGTGHILQRSVEEVGGAVFSMHPDIVAVELDYGRFKALEGAGFRLDEYRNGLSFWGVLSASLGGGSFPVFVQGVLALVQQGLGEKYGIRPGSDMCAAILCAREVGAGVALIDRDIGVTMNRALQMPVREMFGFFSNNTAEMGVNSEISMSNLEDILEKDNLDAVIAEFKRTQPTVFSAFVDERDRYMADQLARIERENQGKSILAVVGAGHVTGLEAYLNVLEGGGSIETASLLTEKSIPPLGWLPCLLPWLPPLFLSRSNHYSYHGKEGRCCIAWVW